MNPTKARKLLAERSGGRCEICAVRLAREAQHRKNRSQGGTWDLSNLLHVCGFGNTSGCHGLIHQRPEAAYANGWSVRECFTPAHIPAWLTADFGRVYVWLRDDGSREPVDMPDLLGAFKAETIHERTSA